MSPPRRCGWPRRSSGQIGTAMTSSSSGGDHLERAGHRHGEQRDDVAKATDAVLAALADELETSSTSRATSSRPRRGPGDRRPEEGHHRRDERRQVEPGGVAGRRERDVGQTGDGQTIWSSSNSIRRRWRCCSSKARRRHAAKVLLGRSQRFYRSTSREYYFGSHQKPASLIVMAEITSDDTGAVSRSRPSSITLWPQAAASPAGTIWPSWPARTSSRPRHSAACSPRWRRHPARRRDDGRSSTRRSPVHHPVHASAPRRSAPSPARRRVVRSGQCRSGS